MLSPRVKRSLYVIKLFTQFTFVDQICKAHILGPVDEAECDAGIGRVAED